jgi:hypothetical protein
MADVRTKPFSTIQRIFGGGGFDSADSFDSELTTERLVAGQPRSKFELSEHLAAGLRRAQPYRSRSHKP